MTDSNNLNIKKTKKSKDKTISIYKIDRNCSCLVYYDNDELVKSKMFYYPIMSTSKERKKVDRILSKEYQLWLHTLWSEGYLETDDRQFHKDLTNLNNVI